MGKMEEGLAGALGKLAGGVFVISVVLIIFMVKAKAHNHQAVMASTNTVEAVDAPKFSAPVTTGEVENVSTDRVVSASTGVTGILVNVRFGDAVKVEFK
jgi:hypothetical protein